MSTAKRLALIAGGYVLAAAAGVAAVTVNELRMPADVAQGSPGMVAFGDMILFVLVTGFCSLAPTWFLLALFIKKAPRALLMIVLLFAVLGPGSWLAVIYLANGAMLPNLPQAIGAVIGLFVAFIAIPRMVFGPIFLAIEAAIILLVRERVTRALLAAAMLMDVVPLGLFALHLAHAPRY